MLQSCGSAADRRVEALRAAGHEVLDAGHLAEALDLLDAHGLPDLVAVDLGPAALRGHELLARLQTEPRARRMPVLALGDGDGVPQALRLLGVRARLPRLAPPEALVAAVNDLLFRGARDGRKHPRVRVSVPVRVTARGCASFGTASDLSEGGAWVPCPNPLPVGTELELWLSLPHCDMPVRLPARVVRTEDRRGPLPAGMGLCFAAADAPDRALLGEFVRARLASPAG